MGFAGQTPESWRHSVDELTALAPETISTYFLTVRPDAWFSKTGAYQYMMSPDLYERYDYANATFRAAGTYRSRTSATRSWGAAATSRRS